MSGVPLTTIFLDRDGVINKKLPEGRYVNSWSEFEFLPGAIEAIRVLAQAFPRLIVVTNQRGVALGVMSEQDLLDIHHNMLAAVQRAGGRIDAIYYCPHEEGACDCRKPRTGLFERAKRAFPEIDFQQSVVVGDSLADLEAAVRLGCSAVLITTQPKWPGIVEQVRGRGWPVLQVAASLLVFSRLVRSDGLVLQARHRDFV